MDEEDARNWGGSIGIGIIFGFLGTCFLLAGIHSKNYEEEMKLESKIETGYIPKSKIEKIVYEDLDQDGRFETKIKVDDKEYLLKYDSNKNPEFIPYNIEINTNKKY